MNASRLKEILSLDDFEAAARRRLPKSIFGFISGGVETGWSTFENRRAFERVAFVPRVLVDVSGRTIRQTLFGASYSVPIGISPMGGCGFAGFHADLGLARAAAAEEVPFILSSASMIRLEDIAAANPAAWFQAYLPPDRTAMTPFVDRIAAARFGVLVVTVDVPVSGNRENNIRNGYSSPLRPSWRIAMDGLRHPRWLIGTAARTVMADGIPHLENIGAERGAAVFSSRAERSMIRDSVSWADLKWLRQHWKGRLVLKGILSMEDARLAAEHGVDGIIVSNHGGRQLDGALAPLEALPSIAEAVGTQLAIIYDSGIRRGSDLLKALALGAHFVIAGRPFLYAAAVAGEAGVRHAINIFRQEVIRNLALLGCEDLTELSSRVRR